MAEPKLTTNARGDRMHHSVGAVIIVDGKYLLIDRDMKPFGFAALAGHIGENETPEVALLRKVKEESGLRVKKYSLLFEEEVPWNLCRVSVSSHYWYVYRCEVEGEVQNNAEAAKLIGWYSVEEMKKLTMEPVWKFWFERSGVL
jgi:ADP-ribose pyrophosphatase YjhB (NUDIX family)